jgi:hypothetical protein
MRILKQIILLISISNLVSCGLPNYNSTDGIYDNYYKYDESKYYSKTFYSQAYDLGGPDNYKYQPKREINIPDTYYTGAYRSPTSHKDMDKSWVQGQNPQQYTIEVADDEKAARVASKLYRLPKTDRSAELKYQKEGKVFYKGVYGTYNSKEEAEKALNNLPTDLKEKAGVREWGSVQSTVD